MDKKMHLRAISLKITLISLSACVLIAAMAAYQYRTADRYRSLVEIRAQVGDLQTNMLSLRRNEKDFLARKDLLYRQLFLQNFELTLENLQAMQAGFRRNELDPSKLLVLEMKFNSYKDKFLNLVKVQEQIGFSHQDGLHGSMRTAIHQVESLLTTPQHYQLSRDVLMLRRHEKDFMLRNDKKYQEKFVQELESMRSHLSSAHLHPTTKQQITTALAAYEKEFNALATATRIMGYSSDEGLHGEMRKDIHHAESILEQLRQDSLQWISQTGGYQIVQIAVIATIPVLFVIVLIFLLQGKSRTSK